MGCEGDIENPRNKTLFQGKDKLQGGTADSKTKLFYMCGLMMMTWILIYMDNFAKPKYT